MPLPPYPLNPVPGTWASGETPTTGQLRADPANAALLLANPPLLSVAQLTTAQSVGTSDTSLSMDTEIGDSWNGHTPGSGTYRIPLDGWYLTEAAAEYSAPAATNAALVGIQTVSFGAAVNRDGGRGCGNGSTAIGMSACELSQHSAGDGDTILTYGQASAAVTVTTGASAGARFKTVWVGTNDGPTVVASPQQAALWPSGAGTTVTNVGGIPAGATSMTVASTTGMVVGGRLGLDYLNGVQTSAGAETVTITSIAGSTVGISATAYSHAQTAPVAVPVSAAWMNAQVRDVINYLAYPAMCNLNTSGTAATLASGGSGTAITFLASTIDNFTGWSGSTYTIPVSGVYFVFGQVYLANHGTYEAAAGLSVAGGTTQWGTTQRNTSSTANFLCATVRRHLRLTAGQTVQLIGYQNSGVALGLEGAGNAYCKLICVWRGF